MDITLDAFISYSRTDDLIARALQQALEYQVVELPQKPKHRLRVFLDRNDMSTGDYYDLISVSLASAKKLIVLCSPAARSSHFVNDEIERFLSTHPASDIVPVLVRGDPLAHSNSSSEGTNPFPESLLSAIGVPALADLRHFQGHWRALKRPKYSEPWYSILSQLVGIPRRELEKREQKRDRARWIWTLSGAFGLIAILSVALVITISSRYEAQSQQAIAENRSRILVSANIARHVVNADDSPPDRDMLLAAQAGALAQTPSSLGALLTSLDRNRNFYRILRLPAHMRPRGAGLDDISERVRSVATSANGGLVAAITDKHWLVLDVNSGLLISSGILDQGYSRVFFATSNSLLLRDKERGGIFILNIGSDEAPRRAFSESIISAAASEATGVVAFVTDSGTLIFWNTQNSSRSVPLKGKLSTKAIVHLSADGKVLTIFDRGMRDTYAVEGAGVRAIGRSIPYPQLDQAALIKSSNWRLPRLPQSLASQLGADRAELFFNALEGMRLSPSNRRDVLNAQLSLQGDKVIVGTVEGTVSILDTTYFENIYTWNKSQYNGTVNEIFRVPMGVAWSADGNTAVAGFLDGEIWVWQLSLPPSFVTYKNFEGESVMLSSHAGQSGFSISVDGANYSFIRAGDELEVVSSKSFWPPAFPSDKPGRVFVVKETGGPGSRVWLLDRVQMVEEFMKKTEISDDQAWLLKRALKKGQGPQYMANDANDPDGSVLFIVDDTSKPAPKAVTVGWGGMVVASGLSSDQSTFAVARENGSLVLIDVKKAAVSEAPIGGTYNEEFRQVKSLVLSHDGRTVWWVNSSTTLRQWSRGVEGAGIEDFREFKERLSAIAASADGKYLVLGDTEGGLRIIDAATLNSVSSRIRIFDSDGEIEKLSMFGDQIAVQSRNRIAVIDLNVNRLIDQICKRVGRGLTQSEVQKYTLGLTLEPLCTAESNVGQISDKRHFGSNLN